MKELSIEEKAKRYELALEKCRKLYNEAKANEYISDIEDYETIFPELKESEEEKIRKGLIEDYKKFNPMDEYLDGVPFSHVVTWLEKQDNKVIKCPQNHQSSSIPDGHIVLEDFNGGEGFYKVHLDYLNKKQVEEVEEMDRMWNKESNTSNEIIKNCIGMCLTDANEQRFKDYGTNLKECLAWLEKQGKESPEKEFTFKALPRLLEMIEVSDRVKAYTEKLAVALDNEGYHTDAKIVRENIKIMNGEEVPMATMDEDEKTRKEIVGYLKKNLRLEWATWLEKKGQKKCIDDLTQQEAMDIAVAKCFEQGEQKPVLDIEIPFGAKDSELQEATYLIPEGFHAEIKDDEVIIKKGKQKPAEWSEEDETGWANTMIMIKECAANHYTKDSIGLVLNWLKSLKQRHVWKPSEEQISALDFAIDCTVYPEFQDKIKVLIELLEQLKKL